MKRSIRVIALFLIAAITVVGFAGCGAANNAPENPILCITLNYGENDASADSGSVDTTPTPSAIQTPTPSATPSETPSANTSEAPSSTAPSNTPDASKPANNDTPASNGNAASQAADVVNYYKECYTKIASDAKGAVLTWNNTQNSPSVLEVGALSSIASTLMGTFLKEANPNTELAPADVPPKGVTTCNLTADMVETATRKDNGDTYEVYIKLKVTQDAPDVNPGFGGGKAGTIVDVVVVSDITDAAGSFIDFQNVQNSYFDTEITAKIDKATGHITELYTKSPSIMSFGKVAVKPLGFPSIENAKIGLTYENRYTINY